MESRQGDYRRDVSDAEVRGQIVEVRSQIAEVKPGVPLNPVKFQLLQSDF